MSTSTRLHGSQTHLDATNLDADGAIAEVKQRLQLFRNRHHLNEQNCTIYRQTEHALTLALFLINVNFTNLSRYSEWLEKSYCRQYSQPFNFMALNA
jgi:hypothetical protein